MRQLRYGALVVLMGLFMPALSGLANGPEIKLELDDILKTSKTKVFIKPASPAKGDDVNIYVEISNEGNPVHDAWVELLIVKVGGKGLGDLVKGIEKKKGLYVGPYKFDKAGTYDIEVSGNYIPLQKYQVTVKN